MSRQVQNVGTHQYKIEFFRGTAPIPNTTINGTNTVIQATPTLAEWGLIALAVLLAGGMGYMLYRRRPALRPAAP
ncbi:MAG: IPTL-CTERM sorting domain-containing protein [Candidatus Bipolaricaulota bacterium]|nr:IPTL-CTERM sorting domain-containing protein [Candidatus Bipolaricaulota bacterium]